MKPVVMNEELRRLTLSARDLAESEWEGGKGPGSEPGGRGPPPAWWARRACEILLGLLEGQSEALAFSAESPSPFTTPLVVSFIGPKRWRLFLPFRYDVGHLGSGDTIEVPRGFDTDGASIPRALWGVYQPWGTWGKAAVVHDYLYRTQTRTRREADAIFHEAMRVLGVPRLRARILWAAVRTWGWLAWRGNRKKAEGGRGHDR